MLGVGELKLDFVELLIMSPAHHALGENFCYLNFLYQISERSGMLCLLYLGENMVSMSSTSCTVDYSCHIRCDCPEKTFYHFNSMF